MGAAEWITLGIFTLLHLGAMVTAIVTMRVQIVNANARLDALGQSLSAFRVETSQEMKDWRGEVGKEMGDLRRDVSRIGEGLARLTGKVNGLSK